MKHWKKLSAIILSAIMLTTACSGSTSPDSGTQIKDSDPTASENAGTDDSAESTDNSNDTVSASKSVKDVIGDIKVDTKVKILSWYDLNDTGVAKTYKELFGVPEKTPTGYEESNLKKNNSEVSVTEKSFANIPVTAYISRYTDLAKLIQSDNSPDAMPAELFGMMYHNANRNSEKFFESVDDVIDFGLSELIPYSKIQNDIRMFDKNYCPIYNVSPESVLWYRSSVIKDAGLEDPWELYEKDEWTWSKFLEICEKFSDRENGKYGIDGYCVTSNLLATTGIHIIGNDNGMYVNNVSSDKVIAAMDFLRQFDTTQKSLRYPKEVENNWSPSYYEWASGNTLFFEDGFWRYDEVWARYKKKEKWNDDEINFVPFPRFDNEQIYSQNMRTSSYLLPKGSKNKEGYKSLVYAEIYARNDAEILAAAKQFDKTEYEWNDKLLDRKDKISSFDTFNWVYDYSQFYNFSIESVGCGDNPIKMLLQNSYMSGVDYRKVIEQYGSSVEACINELNTPYVDNAD